MIELTREAVIVALDYDPKSGIMTWRGGRRRVTAGRRAGCQNRLGYRQIKVLGHLLLGHRLAWFIIHGEWPAEQIDHINQDKSDNRIANLRLASKAQNRHNCPALDGKSSIYIGVSKQRDAKRKRPWRATIRPHGRRANLFLGHFETEIEAARAYDNAAREHYGTFASLNFP